MLERSTSVAMEIFSAVLAAAARIGQAMVKVRPSIPAVIIFEFRIVCERIEDRKFEGRLASTT